MKRILTSWLAITTLVLSQPIFATEWQPILEITDLEKGIIEQATRQFPDWIYKDAEAFTVKHQVVLKILLKNGVVRYYAVGGDNDQTVEQNRPEGSENYRTNESTELDRIKLNRAFTAAAEFMLIWSGKKGGELSTDELISADKFVYEYLNILNNSDPLLATKILKEGMMNTMVIGARGIRYLSAFERLNLETLDTTDFYQAFIVSDHATEEDQPTDQEKIEAIDKIKKLLRLLDNKQKVIYLREDTKNEIKRLDPAFYKSLTNLNLESNQTLSQ